MSQSEDQLISAARDAVSQCNWVVGECASNWTQKYARGRTDSDFGQMVGLSGDQIYQRRRVWEKFGNGAEKHPNLKWSFFYVALNWDDAEKCLMWADDNEATVSEMRAWRRAQNGEDLLEESPEEYSEWAAPLHLDTQDMQTTAVKNPEDFVVAGEGPRAGAETYEASGTETMAGAARDTSDYAPFRGDAAAPAPGEQAEEVAVLERPEQTDEQQWKRLVGMLERLNSSLDASLMSSYTRQPEKVQMRWTTAFAELQEKLSDVV